jgi:hypothetical protein
MPLALVLGFKLEMGLVGFWVGFMIAMFLLDVVVTYIIVTADWEIGLKQSEEQPTMTNRLTRQNSLVSCGSENSLLAKEPRHRLEVGSEKTSEETILFTESLSEPILKIP